ALGTLRRHGRLAQQLYGRDEQKRAERDLERLRRQARRDRGRRGGEQHREHRDRNHDTPRHETAPRIRHRPGDRGRYDDQQAGRVRDRRVQRARQADAAPSGVVVKEIEEGYDEYPSSDSYETGEEPDSEPDDDQRQ